MELRLFGSVPFVMAMIVMVLTTMAFRGSEPMLSVFMQRLLGWEPVLVAWVQMLPNLVYGAMVILVGRLADRVPCHVLVMSGLALYAGAFWGYAGINELTTVAVMLVFLILRSTAEAAIGSPNNLATLQALPESKVHGHGADRAPAQYRQYHGHGHGGGGVDVRYPTACSSMPRLPRWMPSAIRRRSKACSRPCNGRGAGSSHSDPDAGPDAGAAGGRSQHGRLAGLFPSIPAWPWSRCSRRCPAGGVRSMIPPRHRHPPLGLRPARGPRSQATPRVPLRRTP